LYRAKRAGRNRVCSPLTESAIESVDSRGRDVAG
jgi:hypothetical protein